MNPDIVPKYVNSFPHFNAFHAVSKAIALEAVKYGSEITKTKVIPGAVFKELLDQEVQINNNPVVKILSVGRFHWKKGYTIALDACKLLMDENIDFEYTIIGGVGKEEIPFQRKDLDLCNKVRFIDRVPHAELLEMYKLADVFLLPSVEEGIANVVLEAMAIGIPVISTNCGGMSEVIEEGINGWLVPTRCPAAIAESIKKFMACDQEKKLSIINHARLTIKKAHLIPDQVAQMIDLYDDLLNDVPLRKKQLV